MNYLLFLAPFILLGLGAQAWVKRSFAKWSEVDSGFDTGAHVARQILDANGLAGVPIEVVQGQLNDHYDPRGRVIRLSSDVANSRSVASVSVAAHEVGHAIQHGKSMALFQVRSALAGPVGMVSRFWVPLVFGGFILHAMGLVVVGVALYALAVLFSIVTLPIEFDASRRARNQLKDLGMFANPQVAEGSRNVLSAAAMTYVAGALAAVAQLLYFLALLNNR